MDTESTAGGAAAPDTPIHVRSTGQAGEMWGLAIRIFLLNIVTATVYRFWGTTAVRRYIWSHTTINGEPVEYLGKGSELLIGFIIVVVFILAPLFGAFYAAQTYFPPGSAMFVVSMAAFYIVFFFLIGLAIYRALRYRLSRTAWRGIRFGLTGAATPFALKFLGLLLLNVVTLGWVTPVLDTFVMRRLSNDAVFGQTPFQFDGKASRLYGPFAWVWFLGLIAYIAIAAVVGLSVASQVSGIDPEDMGGINMMAKLIPIYFLVIGFIVAAGALIMPIYGTARIHAWVAGLRFEGLTFTTNVTYGGLLGLTVTNALLIIFTLGIGTPIAHMRSFKFVLGNLKAHGTVDLSKIMQGRGGNPRFGEGLADAFDIGGI